MIALKQKAIFKVAQRQFLIILLVSFALVLVGIGTSGYFWHQKNEVESRNNSSSTEVNSLQARVDELNAKLQDSNDSYNKLSNAVLNEHPSQVSAETISTCGHEDSFPSWNKPLTEAQKKYASCVGTVEGSFIQDYINQNQ